MNTYGRLSKYLPSILYWNSGFKLPRPAYRPPQGMQHPHQATVRDQVLPSLLIQVPLQGLQQFSCQSLNTAIRYSTIIYKYKEATAYPKLRVLGQPIANRALFWRGKVIIS